MDIKVTLKSGRIHEFKGDFGEDIDKFMNNIFKAKCVRFGKMIFNTAEIETIEIK